VPVVAGVRVVRKIIKEEDTCCELVLRKKRKRARPEAEPRKEKDDGLGRVFLFSFSLMNLVN
jgi:hypothetical protein